MLSRNRSSVLLSVKIGRNCYDNCWFGANFEFQVFDSFWAESELSQVWSEFELSLNWVWAEFELSMSWVWADDEEFFFTCCNFIVHLNFGMLVIWYECYYVLLSFHFERNALLSRCFVQGFVVKSGRFTHHVAELCEQRAELLGLMLESEGSTCRHVYVESWNIISPDQIYCRMNHRNTR